MKTKKIILFIVEGVTDKHSLALILSRIVKSKEIQFQIVGGDITSNHNTTIQTCIEKVNDEIKKVLNINRFKRTDILKVIHLVDTDGAYVSENSIIYHDEESWIYTSEYIKGNNITQIKERNDKKSKVLSKLMSTKSIAKTAYCMYYFSCNLEHVLHGEQNLSDELKEKYAHKFEDKFYGKEDEFIKFFEKSEFTVRGNYGESWEFIKDSVNSLNRYSNFHLFFQEFRD